MIDSIESSGGSSGLSKSQKKRMKRNNAKAKKADEQEAISKRSQDVGPLNPLDKVKAGLLKLGYSANQIDKALEEMWNTQLPYDDVESVQNFLVMKAHVKRTAEATTVEMLNEIDTAPTKSLETSYTASMSPPEMCSSESVQDNVEEFHESDVFEKGEEDKRDEEEDTTRQTESIVTLASKLDIAANYEELNLAISALSDWVTKTASLEEIREFCNHSKSSAFITIVRRCLKDNGEESKGLIVDLVTSILRTTGMPISAFISVAQSLWNVINTAKSTPYAPLSDGIINTIPFELAFQLSTTLDLLSSSRDETEKTIQCLEMDISEKLSSFQRPMSANAAVEFMIKRDRSHEVVKTSSSVVHLTNAYILGSFTDSQVNTVNGFNANEEIRSLLESLLGDKYEMAQSCRGKIEDLRRKYVESNSSVMLDKDSMRSELQSKKLRQKIIQDKIHELQVELRNLVEEDSLLTQSIAKIAMDLDRLDLSISAEVRQMEKDIESMSTIVALEDLAAEFANCAMDLRTVFRNVATESARSKVEKEGTKLEDNFQVALNRFESYVTHVKTYFEAELNLIEFLKKRYLSLEMNLPILGKQIEECSLLGMKTNVAEMTREYTQSKAKVEEDKHAVSFLNSEAESMKNDYIKQVEEFALVCAKAGVKHSTLGTISHLLNAIRSACMALELRFDTYGLDLFDRFAPEESAPVTEKTKNIASNGHAKTNGNSAMSKDEIGDHSEPPRSVSAVQTVPKPTSAAPLTKRGWGSNVTQQTKQPAQSLIDIQKEQKQST